MKSILVVVVFSFFCLKAMSSGNDHGNGGGVICVNKKCQTLIEAGLQISSEYPDFWIPSENVLKNINTLINKYPFSGNHRVQLRQRVLLNLTHFKIVEVVDPVKLDKIKKLYIDTIKASAPGWDPTNFKIVALSSDDTTADQNTFLLPDFLDLDDEVQSQLLIHEGLYRGRPSSDLKHI